MVLLHIMLASQKPPDNTVSCGRKPKYPILRPYHYTPRTQIQEVSALALRAMLIPSPTQGS
eukprot:1183811-Prorocentrum_minimum.AAC.2